MKRNLLLAAAALATTAATAQYTVEDPGLAPVLAKNPAYVDVIVLDATSVAELQKQGAKVQQCGPDDVNRHWYWWAGWSQGDGTFPGVDFQMDGYISQEVTGDAGWSGGGLAVTAAGALDLKHFTDDTRFHAAFRSDNIPAGGIAVIILDGETDCGSVPAKISIGTTGFVDNGAVFPAVAAFDPEGDWVGIDLSLADLKKLWPLFSPAKIGNWTGNALSVLSGNVKGTNFSIDACYFYTPGGAGVDNLEADPESELVVTANTINAGAANGIDLYNILGQKVRSVKGSVMGIDDLDHGMYIVKSGKSVKKINR